MWNSLARSPLVTCLIHDMWRCENPWMKRILVRSPPPLTVDIVWLFRLFLSRHSLRTFQRAFLGPGAVAWRGSPVRYFGLGAAQATAATGAHGRPSWEVSFSGRGRWEFEGGGSDHR